MICALLLFLLNVKTMPTLETWEDSWRYWAGLTQ